MFGLCNVYMTVVCSVNIASHFVRWLRSFCFSRYSLDSNTYHLIKSRSGSGIESPLRDPARDQRTPEEIAWWNKNVSDTKRAHAKSLPLDGPLPDKLPDPWLFDSELLLRKLEQCRELVMHIPISNPAATQDGIKIALNAVCTLQNDLRFLLHLHREGQREFAKKNDEAKHKQQKKTAAQALSKIVQFRA
jgi:hypothetical protein